jgi:TonB family protein
MGARELPRAAIAAVLALVLAAAAPPPGPDASSDFSIDIHILRSDRRFASEPDPEPRKSPGGIGFGAWRSWITSQDVPEDLRTRPYRAATQLMLDLDPEGRATGCRIVAPSAEPRLDTLACALLRSRGRFEPLYFGPARPVPGKWLMAVIWEALDAAGRAERDRKAHPAVAPPPRTADLPRYRGWPRRAWTDHVRAVGLPAIQGDYPAAAGREGTVSLELALSARDGVTGCTIGISAGDPALDEAACRVARGIELRYIDPCGVCFDDPLPLQVVWARKGSHIRFPLARHRPRKGGETPVRDGADRRTAVYQVHRPEPLPLALSTANLRAIGNDIGVAFSALVSVDPQGGVVACRSRRPHGAAATDDGLCRFLRKHQRFAVPTDIFGDPLPEASETVVEFPPRR